ncbi:SDR family NAD(P)-dependent oxidoreductase [Sporolactobacillus shoreicorticis]|uniref:SDR family NAD(P)-dependent oxidoreductase n=1 Tax=Sporolactobacillus shoreicorticis TaxID=1923877 RepID=A0ABW5S1K3_9BACL|nr:SDR family NAD(P)-dependent oxidoreductase [Sporolactobacillus shoreicorticis]MCO7124506.1 SDR family NAD(P)-dependent oxidoreductase [Sporolactobacillus shoreicorticis]
MEKQAVIHFISDRTGYPPEIVAECKGQVSALGLSTNVVKALEAEYFERFNTTLNDAFNEKSPAAIIDQSVHAGLIEIVRETTGYPQEVLAPGQSFTNDLDMDDQDIEKIRNRAVNLFHHSLPDSVKIDSINDLIDWFEQALSTPTQGVSEHETTVSTAQSGQLGTEQELKLLVKHVIEEQTGYPAEILDEEADLEADLGIDSVKQAEIMSSLSSKLGIDRTELQGTELNSIAMIVHAFYTTKEEPMVDEPAEQQLTDAPAPELNISPNDAEQRVKAIISEQTGYPAEILDLDADLEADLGIDSVKQAEIFAKVQNEFEGQPSSSSVQGSFHTIKDILEQVKKKASTAGLKQSVNTMKRFMAATLAQSMDSENETIDLERQKILLITNKDSRLFFGDLVNQLLSLQTAKELNESNVAFSNSDQLKKKIEEMNQETGPFNCIINLQAVRSQNESFDFSEWQEAVDRIYNGLFYSAKVCYEALEAGGAYYAVTNIGGYFGVERQESIDPLGAVTSGFLKGLEKELRNKIKACKVIDVEHPEDFGYDPYLLAEFHSFGTFVEIGYKRTKRKAIFSIRNELSNIRPRFTLGPDDYVLVTGGGRGITRVCALALQEKTNCGLVIVGRTHLPSGDEEWMTMTDEAFADYKNTYLVNEKQKHHDKTLLELTDAYHQMANARMLFRNIEQLNKKGKKVIYRHCDVTSQQDCVHLKAVLQQKNIHIKGIINGAGLPSFGKVPHKNEELARKVVEVKADSLFLLERYFINDQTEFVISMGSISGRFGMDGQVDYSAGADLIVKYSKKLSLEKGVYAKVIGWPAWDKVGMAATEDVKRVQQEDRGLSYLSPEEGASIFVQELFYGSDCSELLYFDQLGAKNMPLGQLDFYNEQLSQLAQTVTDSGVVIDQVRHPLIDRFTEISKTEYDAEKEVASKSDRFLKEHVVRHVPVLAGVLHLESAAELTDLVLAFQECRQFSLWKISNFDFRQFVKCFEDRPLVLKLKAMIKSKSPRQMIMNVSVSSDFVNKDGIVLQKNRVHSSGEFLFIEKALIRREMSADALTERSEGVTVDLNTYYQQTDDTIRFGEHFRTIRKAQLLGNDRVYGEIEIMDEGALFKNATDTFISPVTIDNIGRLMLMNEYHNNGCTIVPTCINAATFYRKLLVGERVRAIVNKLDQVDRHVMYAAKVYDQEGMIVMDVPKMTLAIINRSDSDHDLTRTNRQESYAVER